MKIREISGGDVPFIFNSWLRSYRESPAVVAVPNSIYYEKHHKVISDILASSYSQVLVACDPDNDEKLYGYAVAEFFPDVVVLHWVYCKQPWRKKHIASAMVQQLLANNDLPVQYSHFTRFVKKVNPKIKMTYNPYAAFKG